MSALAKKLNDSAATILLNGEWHTAQNSMKIINPFDNSQIAQVDCADDELALKAIKSAKIAFEQNKHQASVERTAILEGAANLITARLEEFAQTIAAETGKPIVASRKEVTRCVNTLLLSAQEATRLTGETIKFDSDFLYRIYQAQNGETDLSRLSATIGLSFRLSSSSMIFTSDVVTNSGYIVPKNHILRKTESTTDYFKVANRLGFNDYFYDRFLPYYSGLKEGITDDSLMYDTSLNSIEHYLSTSDKITVVHNEDDIILAPGEIDFFKDTFKSRAHIYPTGGHCGNLAYKENVDYMINYFKN